MAMKPLYSKCKSTAKSSLKNIEYQVADLFKDPVVNFACIIAHNW